MAITVLDDISVNLFLTQGPFFNPSSAKDVFTKKNHLGIPFEMEIHSSINGFYRYGYVTIFDDGGYRETLTLTGNEIISIIYKNAFRTNDDSKAPTTIHFNIFDIEEVPYYADSLNPKKLTTKLLKLHLIEAPFFLIYNHNLWQKAYGSDTGNQKNSKKISIDEIFKDHLINDLKIANDKGYGDITQLNIKKMSTSMHFVIPSWKSQTTFSYLLDFCKDENNQGNVKFYTTTDTNNGKTIVNLQSINQMYKNTDVVEFTLTDVSNNFDFKKNTKMMDSKALNQIINYKFLYYDISSVTAGLAGAYMLNYDYEKSRYFTLNDNYEKSNEKKENKYLSNYALWRNDISNENCRQFYLGSFPKDEAKKYLNNKIIKHNHQLKCEFLTYIDERIYPGSKIFAIFMSGMSEFTRDKSQHLLDEHMSDEWIVEEIVDVFKNGKGMRTMTIIKDSFFNLYDTSSGSSNKQLLPKINNINKG